MIGHTFPDHVPSSHGCEPPQLHLQMDTPSNPSMCTASNRVGNWLLSKGVKRGDIVSLMMTNKPEFISCWLGINRIGAIGAFINTNLSGKPLTHSLRTATSSILILDPELTQPVADSLDEIQQMGYTIYAYGEHVDFAQPMDLTQVSDADTPDHLRRGTTLNDIAMLIYTSGTTGLPKAGRFSHARASSKFLAP